MEILTPVYLLVKDCYGPTISSKILLAQHTTKVRKTSPHVFKPPRLSIVDNVLNLLSVLHLKQILYFEILCSPSIHFIIWSLVEQRATTSDSHIDLQYALFDRSTLC
jgi:hypothetical protein